MGKNKKPILLVICCSILGTAAQILFKLFTLHKGEATLPLIQTVTDPYLLTGLFSYALSFALLTLALKDGELSTIYPFLGLTFVWVTIFSPLLIPKETYSLVKFIGVIIILFGVTLTGYGGSRDVK